MSHDELGRSRRDFLRLMGAAGAGTLAAGVGVGGVPAEAKEAAALVPTRPFGKSGRQVSMLALGGMFDIPTNQLMLRQALRLGVTYWDTADCYGGGRSEEGMGMYFKRFPEARAQVFLVSKSDARDPEGMTKLLERSLERLNTDYIDMYFVHGISGIDELNDQTRRWAEGEKKTGRIKLFGFSTHRNMPELLAAAPKLGYIDGIMMTYNYRLLADKAMQDAIEACHQAGIGLTAMKTMAGGPAGFSGQESEKLAERFLGQGYSPEQAKLKAVWQDRRIASLCSQMPNLAVLAANAAAAMDKTKLAASDLEALVDYACASRDSWCAGCANLCEEAVDGQVPVAEVMRFLMYNNCHREPELARELFGRTVPGGAAALLAADYGEAQRSCPQGLDIAGLMRQAASLWA